MHPSIAFVLVALLATACGQTLPPVSCDALVGHVVDMYADSERPPIDARSRPAVTAGCESAQAGAGWAEIHPKAACALAATDEAALLECGFSEVMSAFMSAGH